MEGLFRVSGKPFFTIGGQTHNSSSWSKETMQKAWVAAEQTDINTVAVPVCWCQLEEEEGKFNYSQVDFLLEGARKRKLHLILLWFGTWKNGTSHYAPAWVKQQKEKYLWAKDVHGGDTRILSPHGKATLKADKNAFEKLMNYIYQKDGKEQTVIGVQVENEPGLMGIPRDYSELGEMLYRQCVPEEVTEWIQTLAGGIIRKDWEQAGGALSGNWEKMFGEVHGAEIFTAYSVAKYIDEIAEAGKKIYNIPIYVNVWLGEMQNRIPGIDYPSGGAVSGMLDIWKMAARHVDAICPDIYIQDLDTYDQVCNAYHREDNILYIPESGPTELNALHVFRQIEKNQLSGIHFFGLDSIVDKEDCLKAEAGAFVRTIRILQSAKPILEWDEKERQVYAVTQYEGKSFQCIDFGDYLGYIRFFKQEGGFPGLGHVNLDTFHREPETIEVRGKGLIFYLGKGEFYLAGEGYSLTLTRKDNIENMTCGVNSSIELKTRNQKYLVIEEGKFDGNGKFVVSKSRCGDESDYGAWTHYDIGLVHLIVE